jgi:transcription initiation factor IIE alpha subunit
MAEREEAKQILNILREKGPVGETELQAWTLLDFDTLHGALADLYKEGLVTIDSTSWASSGGMVKLTTKGLRQVE